MPSPPSLTRTLYFTAHHTSMDPASPPALCLRGSTRQDRQGNRNPSRRPRHPRATPPAAPLAPGPPPPRDLRPQDQRRHRPQHPLGTVRGERQTLPSSKVRVGAAEVHRFRLQHRQHQVQEAARRVGVSRGLRAAAAGAATATARLEMVRWSRVEGTAGQGMAREAGGRGRGRRTRREDRAMLTLALRQAIMAYHATCHLTAAVSCSGLGPTCENSRCCEMRTQRYGLIQRG